MGSAALSCFDQFLECREQAEASGQNAVHAGDGHAVVRKGNPLVLCALHAVQHLPLGEHAPAAVQHKGKPAEVLGKSRAGAELDQNVRPTVGPQPSGKLHGSLAGGLPTDFMSEIGHLFRTDSSYWRTYGRNAGASA